MSKKLKNSEVEILEKFATDFKKVVNMSERAMAFIDYDDKYEKDVKVAIELLHRKVKEMEKSEDINDLNNVIKIKRLIKYQKYKRKEESKK